MPLNTAMRVDTPYRADDGVDARRSSALRLVMHLLDLQGALPAHHRELLSIALWKWTEADGVRPYAKYKIRMRSSGAIDMAVPASVNHEHVFPRKWLVDRLLAGRGDWDESSLRRFLTTYGVACTVTVEEHARLGAADGAGWERYASAGVRIIDMQTGDEVFPALLQPEDADVNSVSEMDVAERDPVDDDEAEEPPKAWVGGDVQSVLGEHVRDATPLIRRLVDSLADEAVAVVVGRSKDELQPIYLRVHDTVVGEPTPAVRTCTSRAECPCV